MIFFLTNRRNRIFLVIFISAKIIDLLFKRKWIHRHRYAIPRGLKIILCQFQVTSSKNNMTVETSVKRTNSLINCLILLYFVQNQYRIRGVNKCMHFRMCFTKCSQSVNYPLSKANGLPASQTSFLRSTPVGAEQTSAGCFAPYYLHRR